MTSNESDSIERYGCTDCDKSFDSETGKKIHHSKVHKDGSKKKEYECGYCGEMFEDYASRRETRGRETFYCSTECSDADKFDTDAITVECEVCGEEIRKTSSQQDEMGNYELENHFCSKECESEWKRSNWVGENHPSWHGGSPDYYGNNWIQQRRQARKRDGYTCQRCGVVEDNRQHDVHHIDAFDPDEEAEKQNRLENLVTLCRSCHRMVEENGTTGWR